MAMSQCDFPSLAVQYEPADESPTAYEAVVGDILMSEESAVLTKNEDKNWSAVYVPVNFIPAEAYSLIAAWEASNLPNANLSDRMELDETFSHNLLEHSQCLEYLAPPMRFNRTFWRSLFKRLLSS